MTDFNGATEIAMKSRVSSHKDALLRFLANVYIYPRSKCESIFNQVYRDFVQHAIFATMNETLRWQQLFVKKITIIQCSIALPVSYSQTR